MKQKNIRFIQQIPDLFVRNLHPQQPDVARGIQRRNFIFHRPGQNEFGPGKSDAARQSL
jgi:hypothetical protein